MYFTWNKSYPAMWVARYVSDCLPEPPTPTSKAWLRRCLRIREIRHRCSTANLKERNIFNDLTMVITEHLLYVEVYKIEIEDIFVISVDLWLKFIKIKLLLVTRKRMLSSLISISPKELLISGCHKYIIWEMNKSVSRCYSIKVIILIDQKKLSFWNGPECEIKIN